MRDADELRREGPELHRPRLGVGLLELGRAQEAVLVELRLDQPQRQARRPDLADTSLPEQVRQRAHVVLVPVREQHRPHRLLALGEVREIRKDQVDAEVLVTRKRKPCVDDDHLAVGFEDGHVLADLAEAAEGDDSDASRHWESLAPAPG